MRPLRSLHVVVSLARSMLAMPGHAGAWRVAARLDRRQLGPPALPGWRVAAWRDQLARFVSPLEVISWF